jgi:hypothetical protein
MPDGTQAPSDPLRTAHAPDAALRVAPAALDWDAAPLPADAGALAQAVAALGRGYFGAIDAGEIETMLGCLDPEGFDIHVLAPDAHLTDTAAYRAWHDRITGAFARLRHTIVALAPRMTGPDTATVALSVHSEVDRRDPGAGEPPRANVSLDILRDLARRDGGASAMLSIMRPTDSI